MYMITNKNKENHFLFLLLLLSIECTLSKVDLTWFLTAASASLSSYISSTKKWKEKTPVGDNTKIN
jgi:hypothetical protein